MAGTGSGREETIILVSDLHTKLERIAAVTFPSLRSRGVRELPRQRA
jgi:hypothetical protein